MNFKQPCTSNVLYHQYMDLFHVFHVFHIFNYSNFDIRIIKLRSAISVQVGKEIFRIINKQWRGEGRGPNKHWEVVEKN